MIHKYIHNYYSVFTIWLTSIMVDKRLINDSERVNQMNDLRFVVIHNRLNESSFGGKRCLPFSELRLIVHLGE